MVKVRSLAVIALTLSAPALAQLKVDSSFNEGSVNSAGPFDASSLRIARDAKGNPIFDTNLLYGSGNLEIANLDGLNQALPGVHNVDIFLNAEKLVSVDVEFRRFGKKVIPCITYKLLNGLNVDFDALPAANKRKIYEASSTDCLEIGELIPGADAQYDLSSFGLDINIPQAFLKKVPRGYVSSEFWDRGINAGVLSYRLGHYRTEGSYTSQSSYASLQGGFNYNGWALRHFGYFNNYSNTGAPSKSTYDSINTYVERALPEIRSNLVIGDSFTDGSFYDSIGIRGVKLSSSELMLPASQRGYSPVVRGVALTNAQVEVFQNGILIYKTTVPPGPFAIDDLYQSSNNANYEVTVTEADGRKSSFIVPSSITPQLIREGQFRYSAAFGKYRNAGNTYNLNTSRLTMQYGLTNYFTGYSGVTSSKNFYSILMGGAYGTDYGTFLADVDFAKTTIGRPGRNETYTGSRLKLGYGNYIASTQSGFDFSLYSYNNNYWDLDSKVNYENNFYEINQKSFNRNRRKIQLTFSQSLNDWGTLYVTAARTKFWDDNNSLLTAQAGYTKNFKVNNYSFGMNLSYMRSRTDGLGDINRDRVSLTFTFPLGTSAPSNLSTSVAYDKVGGSSQQVRLNGVAGEDYRLGYGIYADRMSQQQTSAGGNVQYKTNVATLDGSMSRSANSTQFSAAAGGGVVLHANGVTLANQIGDTVGLVHAPGAKGAKVRNAVGVEVDSSGYAVSPYLNAYQQNNVLLDTKNVPSNVNFRSTTEQAIPYKNAVVLLKFDTILGQSVIFDIDRKDGTPPPFGATIYLPDDTEVGLVGQGGNSFVYGLKDQGSLNVKWGDAPDQQCIVDYNFNNSEVNLEGYVYEKVTCR